MITRESILEEMFELVALPTTLRDRVVQAPARRLYARGSHLFERGSPAQEAFYLRRGRVHVFCDDAQRHAITIVARPGTLIGAAARVDRTHHAVTALAARDCEVFAFSVDAIRRLLYEPSSCERHDRVPSIQDPRVLEAIRLIHECLHDERFGARDVSARLDLSLSHLSRLFIRDTGVGPREYLRTLRLRIAGERLRATRLTIKQIYVSVGYRHASAFTHQFRAAHGCSPTAYRRHGAAAIPADDSSPPWR